MHKTAHTALALTKRQVDTDADGYIGGAEGAAFIRRARLLNDANREVRLALTHRECVRALADAMQRVSTHTERMLNMSRRSGGWRVAASRRRSSIRTAGSSR